MEIAIIIATYNSANYIIELLESLERQTYTNFSCYIHDDGSSDETMDLISEYKKCSQMDIRILNYPHVGSAKGNFLSMLNYVNEPYIMFCDHDDVWLDYKVEKSIKKIKEVEGECTNRPVLVFSDLVVVNENLETISNSFMKYGGLRPDRIKTNQLLIENMAPGCTMIANKALYSLARKITDINSIIMHDHFFMLVASCFGQVEFLNEPLLLYRQHGDNEVGAAQKIATLTRVRLAIMRLSKGKQSRDYKIWLSDLQKQAQAVADIPGLPENKARLCKSFATISDKNKIERVLFFVSRQVIKRDHKLWFLLWC